jgi:hypothetical protein
MPVEAFPPNTMAIMAMFTRSIPLSPAFERPITKAAIKINSQLMADKVGIGVYKLQKYFAPLNWLALIENFESD